MWVLSSFMGYACDQEYIVFLGFSIFIWGLIKWNFLKYSVYIIDGI